MTASSLRTVSVAARTVLVALMVLATCTFLPSQQADAAVPCGTGGNYFKGYIHEPSAHADNFEGASGYITNRFADTCDSDTSSPSPLNQTIGTNFTTAWIMIADYTVTSWSQVGVISGYDLNAYFWAEVLRASPYEQYDRFVSLNAIGYDERHAYFEKWLSYCPPPTNGPCEESVIDSTRVTDTNFNPFTYFNGGPGAHSEMESAVQRRKDLSTQPNTGHRCAAYQLRQYRRAAIFEQPVRQRALHS